MMAPPSASPMATASCSREFLAASMPAIFCSRSGLRQESRCNQKEPVPVNRSGLCHVGCHLASPLRENVALKPEQITSDLRNRKVNPQNKKYFSNISLYQKPKSAARYAHPVPIRGACARQDVGRGCGGREGA